MASPALTPQNYYATTLTSSITTTDTTIFVGTVPTGSEGYLEIGEGLSTKEIIFFNSKGANFVTCPSVAAGRGVGGTSAAAHTAGEIVKQKLNAEWWLKLQDGTAQGINSVAAQSLATSAITLGYTQITSNQTGFTSGTQTQITGLTVTVTIPAGGRRIKITGYLPAVANSSASTGANLGIWDGVVASGTQLQIGTLFMPTVSTANSIIVQTVVTPAAGSKTYNLGYSVSTGSGTITASASQPAFILVEAI